MQQNSAIFEIQALTTGANAPFTKNAENTGRIQYKVVW